MKPIPAFFKLLPPAPATRLEIEAFHLRERRLQAVLAAGICLLLSVLAAILCHTSADLAVRAGTFTASLVCAAVAGIYGALATVAQLALRKKRKEAGRDA